MPKATPKKGLGWEKPQPEPRLAFKEAGIVKDLTLNLQNLAQSNAL